MASIISAVRTPRTAVPNRVAGLRRNLRTIGASSRALVVVVLMVVIAAVIEESAPSGATEPPADSMLPAHWVPLRHIPAVVDLTGARRDGQLTLAVGGRLSLLGPGGVVAFARNDHGYSTDQGTEPYIALAPDPPVVAGKRSFTRDDVFALEPGSNPAVIRIDGRGHATRFARLPPGSFPNGITFDTTGGFGHRLLVSVAVGKATRILSIDSRGGVRTLTRRAPRVEGGIVVAPPSFGVFAGDLIAPDELNGSIYAVDPKGRIRTVAASGLPHGGDIGVESEGFVPNGFSARSVAYLADRSVPGNAHPGTNSILELAGPGLERAGVQPGDLLVASEGGAETISVRCQQTCTVTHVAAGPAPTHAEGHIIFSAASQ